MGAGITYRQDGGSLFEMNQFVFLVGFVWIVSQGHRRIKFKNQSARSRTSLFTHPSTPQVFLFPQGDQISDACQAAAAGKQTRPFQTSVQEGRRVFEVL